MWTLTAETDVTKTLECKLSRGQTFLQVAAGTQHCSISHIEVETVRAAGMVDQGHQWVQTTPPAVQVYTTHMHCEGNNAD